MKVDDLSKCLASWKVTKNNYKEQFEQEKKENCYIEHISVQYFTSLKIFM